MRSAILKRKRCLTLCSQGAVSFRCTVLRIVSAINPEVVALIGAQFQRHGTGVFTVRPTDAAATHPLMKGYNSFESWDETYVHTLHNERDRTVLEYRQEGDQREPWTWVRTQGDGRVFYTAWGHDERTFGNPGFQNLVERGIRWACGQDPSVVPEFAGVEREAAG